MTIRKAELNQFQAVRELYYDIIDAVGDSGDSVGWKKDIYPTPDFLSDSIGRGELFIAEEGDTIVGVMVLNHLSNDEYQRFQWPTQAEESEVTVIHALGIRPSCRGKGWARQMVRFALDYARENQQKVIRLDVLKSNQAAKKLYSGMGFRYLHSLPMFYEDTGWTDFELYEYPLQQFTKES